jgi:hypothetical protein
LVFAAAAVRLRAATNASAESVVFTIFLLWGFSAENEATILPRAKPCGESMPLF